MGAKVWSTAAVVIAAAAAAGAGIVTWEGRVWENARLYGGGGTPQWPQNGLAGWC